MNIEIINADLCKDTYEALIYFLDSNNLNYELLPNEPSIENNLVMYDSIDGDFVEIESMEAGVKYVKENYIEGDMIHIDFASFDVFKKVGSINSVDEGDECVGIFSTPLKPEPSIQEDEFKVALNGLIKWAAHLPPLANDDIEFAMKVLYKINQDKVEVKWEDNKK